jgi:hypothetical protein
MNIFKKCVFCHSKKENEEILSAPQYGIYGEVCILGRQYFHKSCIKEILCDPEKYENKKVDLAIEITERFQKEEEINFARMRQIIQKRNDLCKYWNQKK